MRHSRRRKGTTLIYKPSPDVWWMFERIVTGKEAQDFKSASPKRPLLKVDVKQHCPKSCGNTSMIALMTGWFIEESVRGVQPNKNSLVWPNQVSGFQPTAVVVVCVCLVATDPYCSQPGCRSCYATSCLSSSDCDNWLWPMTSNYNMILGWDFWERSQTSRLIQARERNLVLLNNIMGCKGSHVEIDMASLPLSHKTFRWGKTV